MRQKWGKEVSRSKKARNDMEERQEVRAISWTFPVCPPRANGKYNYRIYVSSSGYSPSLRLYRTEEDNELTVL
jgi:hypothetical protein